MQTFLFKFKTEFTRILKALRRDYYWGNCSAFENVFYLALALALQDHQCFMDVVSKVNQLHPILLFRLQAEKIRVLFHESSFIVDLVHIVAQEFAEAGRLFLRRT